MFMDGYNLYGYLLVCIDACNLRWVSIDDFCLYGYLYFAWILIDGCCLYGSFLNV